MKKALLVCFLIISSVYQSSAQCNLPQPYTNGSTGSNLTLLLDSEFIESLNFVSPNPYIVALTSNDLVVGSSYLAPDSLINGMQSIAVWGDDTFTNDVVDGALDGESITLQIVDGIYLYELNSLPYVTNGILPITSGGMLYVCAGAIEGCTDSYACNYNEYANLDDGSCVYPALYFDCDGSCLFDSDLDGICDELEVPGCTNDLACNFDYTADNDDGSCTFAQMYYNCDGTCINDTDNDGVCDELEVPGCIEITPLIVSNSNSDTLEENPVTGEIHRYFDLCAGETLSLQANPDLSVNTNFQWLLDGVVESNTSEFEQTFNNFGGHILTLTTTEQGCDSYSEQIRIRVGTEPVINLFVNPSTVCPGIVTSIGSDVNSDLDFSAEIETGSWGSSSCLNEFTESTYLPDGSGVSYETSITLDCFGESQVLQNVDDIISVDINMEHSYSGDLDIYLTAPNGVQVTLFQQAGGSTWFGEATDGDATQELVGVGSDYGWSMNPDYNGTMADAIAAGNTITVDNLNGEAFSTTGQSLISSTYLPVGNFNDFVGTPLNGDWTITVIDNLNTDNGWIFSWGITINDNIIPSSWSFDNYIVDESFTITNNNIVSYTSNSINIQPYPGINNYTYEVVDNFGCTFNEEIQITATSYINTSLITTQEECGGEDGEIDLNISGGTPDYSVAWNSGNTGPTLNNLSAGTYFYTITDDLGCEMSGNATIDNVELGLLFDTEVNNDQCDQGIGQISLTPLNGSSPYTFNWNNSNLNQNMANNLFAGDYQINIIDNQGCEGDLLIQLNNIFIDIDEDGICDELEPIEGCTYPDALNYNEVATLDDGSCVFEFNVTFENIINVTNIVSIYNIYTVNILLGNSVIAISDLVGVFYVIDGVLVSGGYVIYDGTNPIEIAVIGDDPTTPEVEGFQEGQEIIWIVQQVETEINYLIDVVTDAEVFTPNTEEVVILEEVSPTVTLGCTDPTACNYNEDANLEDGSCKYETQYEDCDGNCINDTDQDEVCDEEDNCVDVVNPVQTDSDNDGEGDACDYDDGIGIDEISEDTPTLIKMIDVLGREQQKHKKGSLLFYIYDNGKVERKFNP